MKKILLLFLILILGIQICRAEEPEDIDSGIVPEEDIEIYFNQEDEAEQQVQVNPQGFQDAQETIQIDNQQPIELNGFIQYNQEMTEPDAIVLDSVMPQSINFSQPKRVDADSLLSSLKKPVFRPIQDDYEPASKFSSQEYDIRPVSTTYGKKVGKFSFGTMYNSSLNSSASVGYSTGLFAKYEDKHFAFGGGFSKSTNYNYDSYSDKMYFVPELKLTKRLSLLDVMQTDVYQIKKSNELVLRYKPNLKKYADDVELELGAGQSYYNDNYVNSSVRFSTRFKL